MPDVILKSIRGVNLNLDIMGFDLKNVYRNVSLGTIADISNLNFEKYQASTLADGLLAAVENLEVNSKNEIIGSESEVTRKITNAELATVIQLFKIILYKRTEIKFTDISREQKRVVPLHERQSWTIQKEEAEKLVADNKADAPFLTELAKARDIDVMDLANSILEKVAKHNQGIAALMGKQKNMTDRIKACTTMHQLRTQEKEIDEAVAKEG